MRYLWAILMLGVSCVSAQGMDEINAGIRARAAAAKGQPVQELKLRTNGTTGVDPIHARKCMAQDAKKYGVPLTGETYKSVNKTLTLKERIIGIDCDD